MGMPFPQELIDEIIDEVAKDPKLWTANLKALSLVSRAWVDRSHKHLFSKKEFDQGEFRDWCLTVRPGEDGPSRHVTRLRYRTECWKEAPSLFAVTSEHIAYFTNVQRLRLIYADLRYEEYVLGFMPLRSALRILELKDCQTNINDLLTFLQPFTNLERLSLLSCYDPHHKKLEKRGKLPTLKGRLDLNLTRYDGEGRSLLHELSLLPLAFSDIVLDNGTMLEGVVNQLLIASRKTLKVIRVTNCNRQEGFIDLRDFDTLEGLQLDVSDISYIPPILQTIASKKFWAILLVVSEEDLEEYLSRPQDWAQLDLELILLADRFQSARNSPENGDGLSVRLDLLVTAPASDRDFRQCAERLLPEFCKHRYTLVTGRIYW